MGGGWACLGEGWIRGRVQWEAIDAAIRLFLGVHKLLELTTP